MPGQLPRRPPRVLPPGRHRSPHRLTVPTDAPPLVLAVPGARNATTDDLVSIVADAVSMSCPNATIRAGYLEGERDNLTALLQSDGQVTEEPPQPAVVIPLLVGPHPRSDAAMTQAIAQATVPVLTTDHLGPHPLVAEAMHARLADAGLARASRVRGLSIANAADGFIVLADRGLESEQSAGVVAVLLASRLACPAAPASIDDRASIDSAIRRLRDSGASVLAVAPCVIGPESDLTQVTALCAALGVKSAEPIGAHPAISQLIAMRYGAALADKRLAV
jgi:sirohydrochlorin ferrochelatase